MSKEEALPGDIDKLTDEINRLQKVCIKASEGEEGMPPDPETLSQTLLQLARTNSALGRRAAYAKYVARNAERAFKAAKDQYKVDAINEGKTASYGDTQREIRSGAEFKIFSDAQLIADEASDLCFRTDTFLKMAQTRVSLIKGDVTRGQSVR